jgi:predicted TIM-barrel fold metal-dependent hydrolase
VTSATPETSVATPGEDAPSAHSLVDCDVHPLVRDVRQIAARMSTRAARRVDVSGHIGGAAREPNRTLHPTGPLRLDAVPPGGGPPGCDPDFARTTWLDRFDISAAVLVPIQAAAVISWSDEDAVGEYLSALNDHLLEEWVALDPRFKLAISVSPHDADSAVREIERLAGTPGVIAVNVPLAEVTPGRPFFKLYEAAADRGLPVLLHPTGAEGNLFNAPTFAGGQVRSYPEHHAMLAHSGHSAAAAIVHSGALQRFPDLKVVFAEFGFSWVAPLMWRMDTAWERNGAEASGLERPPSSYVLDQMRFTTQPMDEPSDPRLLWRMLDAMEAERTLLFSSDYPHWDADDPAVIMKTRLPEGLRERVAYASAVETFGARLDA